MVVAAVPVAPETGAMAGVGIAGGARGSAPWKHGSSTMDSSNAPKSSSLSAANRSRPKRSFFKNRVADVEWSKGVPRVTGFDWQQDDLDSAMKYVTSGGAIANGTTNGNGRSSDNTTTDLTMTMANGIATSTASIDGDPAESEQGESPAL